MNKFSQLLHKQLWSKRTSRIVFAVLVIGCVLALLWTDWVTPGERQLAQETINRADEVASPQVLSSTEFEKQNTVLQQLVDQAKRAQITERDQVVVLLLGGYVTELSYQRSIWNTPEAKLEGIKIAGVSDSDGRQKRLSWLALEEKQHKQNRANLERMIGN
jgi:hypothetical protein